MVLMPDIHILTLIFIVRLVETICYCNRSVEKTYENIVTKSEIKLMKLDLEKSRKRIGGDTR